MITKIFKESIKITVFANFMIFTIFTMCLSSYVVFAAGDSKKKSLEENGVVSEIIKTSIFDNKNNTGNNNKEIGVGLKKVCLENNPETNNIDDVSESKVDLQSTAFADSTSINSVSEDFQISAVDEKDSDNAKNVEKIEKTENRKNIEDSQITGKKGKDKKETKETKEIKKLLKAAAGAKGVKKAKGGKEVKKVKEMLFADNEQIEVVLSSRDINRILVKGDRIQSVNGPTGLYIAKNDKVGSAYISLYGNAAFTVFVSTSKGHNFSLLVVPKVMPGRTVILEPTTPSLLTARFEETESYQKVLITFIKSMINNEVSEDYMYGENVSKNKEDKKNGFFDFSGFSGFSDIADIKQIASYDGSHLLGIIYEIKNKTRKPLVLKPSYFYRPGVRAAALSHQTIAFATAGLLYQVVSKD